MSTKMKSLESILYNPETTRYELFHELSRLQSEMSEIVFGDRHHHFADFIEFFEASIGNKNERFSRDFSVFREACKRMSRFLVNNRNVMIGEDKLFYELSNLYTPNHIISQFECGTTEEKCRIDAVVLTEKKVFVLDIINTVFRTEITADGVLSFYKGEMICSNKNILEKMNNKVKVLKSIFEKNGCYDVDIEPLVVFVDSRSGNKNNCKEIKAVNLVDVNDVIDGCITKKIYSKEAMLHYAEIIESERQRIPFILPFNFDEFRCAFRVLLEAEKPSKETKEDDRSILEALKNVWNATCRFLQNRIVRAN